MKSAIFLLMITGAFLSCTGDDTIKQRIIRENVSLANTENYEYNLGSFGDEEGAQILTQAAHFERSELEREINTGLVIYRYRPENGFTGSDFVEIRTGRGSDGASPDTEINLVRISFTITE